MASDVEKLIDLAKQVMKLSRNTLVIHLRFMDTAISRLQWVPIPDGTFSVDGENIYFNPIHTLRLYGGGKEQVTRAYLHMIFHCIFRHFMVGTLKNTKLWDLACDMAAEGMIRELDMPMLATVRDSEQDRALSEMRKSVAVLTAEKIYQYLLDGKMLKERIEWLSGVFQNDDHSLWYVPPEKKQQSTGSGGDSDSDENSEGNASGNTNSDENSDSGNPGSGSNDSDENSDGENPNGGLNDSDENSDGESSSGGGQNAQEPFQNNGSSSADHKQQLADMWKDVSERMQLDLESFSKQHGDSAGNLMQSLRAMNREKYDYTEFLKKFAVMGEVMRLNQDEFDYIFYSYGMKMFPEKRMPLIEPLEYKDDKRIREFVIAIDTSGSVQGEMVQAFLQKTYNILQSTESFFSKINLHIIQCDASIQEHVRITTKEEFENYLKGMRLKGFGGTDFRPVFHMVDELIRTKQLTDLKGMIYFTDGYGTFPERMPSYRTAFVFVDDGVSIPEVPTWAIRLVLPMEDL